MILKIEYLICLDEMIISDVDKIYGFFQMSVAGQLYGYCPDDTTLLPASDILSVWFEQLAEVYTLVESHDYILIKDIDSFNSWIEIRRFSNMEIDISHIISEEKNNSGIIRLEPLPQFEYGLWKRVRVNKSEFLQELHRVILKFIAEVSTKNPLCQTTYWYKRIADRLDKI